MRAIMKGLTDVEFERLYGTEGQCLAALVAARQREGMPCPRCANLKSYVYGRRVGCTRCGRRWSVTAGTVMADTKLPLTTWFRAMHLMSSTKQAISAVELGRRLGLGYETAWYLHKRLRHAMTERTERYSLGGASDDDAAPPVVEADDVCLGGERNQGSGTEGKTCVIVACERHADGRMGHVAMRAVSAFSSEAVAAFRDAHIAAGATVHTDGLRAFNAFGEAGRTHVATVTGGGRPERERSAPFFTVNTLVANLRYRAQGHPQAALPQASARLSRRLLLDHQPAPQHARHGQRALPCRRCVIPSDPQRRLPVTGRLADKRVLELHDITSHCHTLMKCHKFPDLLPGVS